MMEFFEIVHKPLNERGEKISQAWHPSLTRGQKTWFTDTRSSKRSAQQAIEGLAKSLGWLDPKVITEADGTSVLVDLTRPADQPGLRRVVVRYRQEMTQVGGS